MNTGTIVGIVIAIAVAALVVFLVLRKKQKAADKPIIYSVDLPNAVYTEEANHQTVGGVTVRSAVSVPAAALEAIERGIAHQIRNSSRVQPGWTAFRNLQDYQVFLIDPHTHNVETEPGSPALIIRYMDMNGVDVREIQTAGTCIGVDGAILGGIRDDRYPSMVLPHQAGEDWRYLNYLEESARNESEHLAEWMNDRNMFFTFATAGDVHPHFPDE